MVKYVEVWSEDISFIVEYKKVDDDYVLKEGIELECHKEHYDRNVETFKQKKLSRESYNNNKVHTHLQAGIRREATEEIVKTIKKNHIIITTRSDEKPEMWVYKEGIYVPEAKSLIKSICREILQERHTTQLTNEVIAKIEADTYIDQKQFFNEQNKYPYLIPVKNGLLNLKTRDLEQFKPTIPFFNKINAEYKPKADCPNIKKFIKQITETEEDYTVIQEMIGFCLVKDYKYEKAFMLYGEHGRNGKSKLLELITRFVGVNNISGVSLQDIEKDDFAISNLHNKLVNIAGDISNEAIKNTGKFKSLTGRDTLSANRKFKERIDFINYAKIIFACNELPPVYTISKAFWMRWVMVKFPYQFLPQKEIDYLEDKTNVRLQDPLIINKISSDEELDGFLNFALKGLERLENNSDFSTTKVAVQLEKDWKRESNSVSSFLEDCIKEDISSYIIKSHFLKEYQTYCKKHNVRILSDNVIKQTLKEELGVTESRPYSEFDKSVQLRVWQGIKFKSG